jgi:hypothetical protein
MRRSADSRLLANAGRVIRMISDENQTDEPSSPSPQDGGSTCDETQLLERRSRGSGCGGAERLSGRRWKHRRTAAADSQRCSVDVAVAGGTSLWTVDFVGVRSGGESRCQATFAAIPLRDHPRRRTNAAYSSFCGRCRATRRRY